MERSQNLQGGLPRIVAAPPARQHFGSIDALRGVAALLVCLFHLGGSGLPKLNSPISIALTSWGWTGVEIFFVISGFVIPYALLRSHYRSADAPLFLARRVVRIWPPSAILIGLTICQYVVAQRVGGGGASDWSNLSAARIFYNLTYTVPFTSESWLNGVLWTLSAEFQFYVVLSLVFPLLKQGVWWVLAALAFTCVSALFPFAGTAQFLRYAVYFAMGGVALLHRTAVLGSIRAVGLLLFMTAVGGLEINWLSALFALAAALLICFANLHWPPLLFLGRISYSLYLVHILVGSVAEFLVVRLFMPTTAMERFLGQLACICLAILGAWMFMRCIEMPFIRLSAAMGKASPSPVQKCVAAPGDEDDLGPSR